MAASPALVSIVSGVNPHVAVDTGAAVRLLYKCRVPAVVADTLLDKADRAGKVAGMVVVVDHT